jgi:single-stranded-DNA-specific exonuclease
MSSSVYRHEDIPEPFIALLAKRGIAGKEAVEAFIYPHLDRLPSPFLMKGMREAVDLIIAALAENRKIVLWGDYDVDGTTGVALLISFFRSIGREVIWYIPDRVSEGYGLHLQSLKKIGENICDFSYLLLTIDCGISNFKEIEELRRWGGDVVVTDHHRIPGGVLPPCIVVNPQQDDCGFTGEHLAGAGVAFYLAAAIRAQLREEGYFNGDEIPNIKRLLPFTALGTIADVAHLGLVNRTLVRAGLEALEVTEQHGLYSLLKSSDINGGKVFSEDIGFLLGPKINAAGRMAHAELAVRLLISQERGEAEILARDIENKNKARKKRCADDLEKALSFIDPIAIDRDRCCILTGPFHHGTLGITASRLMEKLQVPVIVLSYLEEAPLGKGRILKGSCRSLLSIDIFKVLHAFKDYLIAYGGHSLAAGLTITEERIESLRSHCAHFISQLPEREKYSSLQPDIQYPIMKLFSRKNLEIFSLLDPFGPGNEKPIFVDHGATIIESRRIGGRKEHLQLVFRGGEGLCKGIGFSLGHKINIARERRGHRVIYTLSPNRYKGKMEWQLRILDIA